MGSSKEKKKEEKSWGDDDDDLTIQYNYEKTNQQSDSDDILIRTDRPS